MTFKSVEDKLKADVKVEAAYKGGIVSASANMSFEAEMKKQNVDYSASSNIRMQGYPEVKLPAFMSLDEIKKLPDAYQNKKGIPLVAGLRKFSEVPGYDEALAEYAGHNWDDKELVSLCLTA
jgi:hypothetical protein